MLSFICCACSCIFYNLLQKDKKMLNQIKSQYLVTFQFGGSVCLIHRMFNIFRFKLKKNDTERSMINRKSHDIGIMVATNFY